MTTRRLETDWCDEPDLPFSEEWEDISDWYERGYMPGVGQDQFALITGDGIMRDWVWAATVEEAWDTLEERGSIPDNDPAAWVTNLSALLS